LSWRLKRVGRDDHNSDGGGCKVKQTTKTVAWAWSEQQRNFLFLFNLFFGLFLFFSIKQQRTNLEFLCGLTSKVTAFE